MDRFRTIKISDPRFESDHLRFITVKTPNLHGRGDICVFVPPETGSDQLPIVTLLHGVYGSANSWSRAAGAHLTALKLIEEKRIKPVILAMPSDGLWGDGSAYLPHHNYNFDRWIAEDVRDAVKLNIPQAINSKISFIAGLSMGGFGALSIGAKYGTQYKGISALSAITSLPQMRLFVEEDITSMTQENPMHEDAYMTILANRANLPALRFDCGKDDLLIEYNRILHQQLESANIPHVYQENEGKHEWGYWEKHLVETLIFFDKQY